MIRTTAKLAAVGLLAAAGLVAPLAPASASASSCDTTTVLDEIFGEIGGGSSFTDRGREVVLRSGKLWDKHTFGRFEGGRQSGDRIWVDRSINTMPLGTAHPSTSQVQSNGGWRQCGPKTGARSDYVLSWHYAVRVCWDPTNGDARCGAWYVDQ